MSDRTVTFGLIGCGTAGKLHAQALREAAGVELRLVCDADGRAARAVGERHGVPWTDDVDGVLNDDAIEAVSIAVPHHLHFDLASRAARAGKHLMLEKPFTRSTAEAAALLRICASAGVAVVPWLERRQQPFVEKARQLVREGVLGRLVYTRICCLGYKTRSYWSHGMRGEEYPSAWRGSLEQSGGGVLLMNAIHQIDLMAHVTGLEVEEVFAHAATLHHEVEVEDVAVVNLRYRGGAMGVVESSCCAYGFGQFPMERVADVVCGTDGFLQLGSSLKCHDRAHQARTFDFPAVAVPQMKVRAVEDFARRLRDGTPTTCGPADALRALAVIESAYRSAATGAPVRPVATTEAAAA